MTRHEPILITMLRPGIIFVALCTAVACGHADEDQTLPGPATGPAVHVSSPPRMAPVQARRSHLSQSLGFLIWDIHQVPTVARVGAGWVRLINEAFEWGDLERSEGTWEFKYTDRWIRTSQEHGLKVLPNLKPFAAWDQAKCQPESCKVGKGYYKCKPCDPAAYRAFVRRVVERYDGDGRQDMPGLRAPVTHWEVMNEPELQSASQTFFIGPPKDFYDIVRWSSEAIKDACPSCKVVVGGAATNEQALSLEYHGKFYQLGGAKHIDVANVHAVEDEKEDMATLNAAGHKAFLKKVGAAHLPLWVTEVQFPDDTPEATLPPAVKAAFNAGAQKLFFTGLVLGKLHGPKPTDYSKVYKTLTAIYP